MTRPSLLGASEAAPIDPAHTGPAHTDPACHSWLFRRTVPPVLALLRLGSSPERLAWSLAAGALIGLNPVLGSTTALCLLAALLFRLNIPASQIGTHLMYPLELMLVLPFLHLGTHLFGTAPLLLSLGAILDTARHAPLTLLREIWMWEWHALIVWAAFAAIALPALAALLTPVLRRLHHRLHHGSIQKTANNLWAESPKYNSLGRSPR